DGEAEEGALIRFALSWIERWPAGSSPLVTLRRAKKKSRQPSRAAACGGVQSGAYFLIWYTRSPASVFVDSILSPCFLAAVERKPRIECFCQSVAFTISASVAPLGRPISSRIFAPLLSARGVLASLAWARLALASFF